MSSFADLISERGKQWMNWVDSGQIGLALNDIDESSSESEDEKCFFRAQVFHRANVADQFIQQAEKLVVSQNTHPVSMIRMAEMAMELGAPDHAKWFLNRAVELGFTVLDELEMTLDVASRLNADELEMAVSECIEQNYPDSTKLRRHRIDRFLTDGDYSAAARECQLSQKFESESKLYFFIADALIGQEIPDYLGAVERAKNENPNWAEAVRVACATHALSSNRLNEALQLFSIAHRSGNFSRREIIVLLRAAQKLVVTGIDTQDESGPSIVGQILLVAAQYIGVHPRDLGTRRLFDELLSQSYSGRRGLTSALYAVLLLEDRPVQLVDREPLRPFTVEELSNTEGAVHKALNWLSERQPCMLGRIVLPKELVIQPADAFLEATIARLESSSFPIEDEGDVTLTQQMLLLGASMSSYCSDPDIDLKLVRLAAGKFALSGHGQIARNLAEQSLEMAQGRPERMRKAWCIVADIYQRLGSETDCLMALCCALSVESEIDVQEAVLETDILIRTLREMGLIDLAKKKLSKLLSTLAAFPRHKSNARLEFSMTQLNVLDAFQTLSANPEKLRIAIEEDLVKSANRALAESDDVMPVAVLFAQAIKWADRMKITVSDNARQLAKSLSLTLGSRESLLLRAVGSQNPTKDDLLRLALQREDAKYSEDIAFDCQHLVIAAKELLAANAIVEDPEAALLATEILAERSVNSADENRTLNRALSNQALKNVASIAKSISKRNIQVLMAALDANDSAVSIVTSGGQINTPIRHLAGKFSAAELRKWSRDFPRAYGDATPDDNVFYTSTESLKIEQFWDPKTPRAVSVMDVRLQEIPPNLIRSADSFCGSEIAIAGAPSLSWLESEIDRDFNYSNRFEAWISSESHATKALTILSERLRDVWDAYSINLNTQPIVPDNLAHADLAIVGAHGSFDERSGIFQRFRDDHELLVEPTELAQALEDVRVVVLFVCHAGRLDKRTSGHGTIGFVKQLLNQRCSSILASPWPLDVSVAQSWLPEMLAALSAGNSVVDANFAANKMVAQRFPFDFSKTLAMNLYGNPFTKIPGLSAQTPRREGAL
jgi:hypothetical protein